MKKINIFSSSKKLGAFSITEILIVIITIAIIAAFALPSYQQTIDDMEENNTTLETATSEAMEKINDARGIK